MRRVKLTHGGAAALAIIFILALAGCGAAPIDTAELPPGEVFYRGEPYLDYLGKTRGEMYAAFDLDSGDYLTGTGDIPNHVVKSAEPVVVDGVEFTFFMQFYPPSTGDGKDGEAILESFGFEYSAETSHTGEKREIIERIYALLTAKFGDPAKLDSTYEEDQTVKYYLASGEYYPAKYYMAKWLLDDKPDYPLEITDPITEGEHYILIREMYANAGVSSVTVTVAYSVVSSYFSRLDV